MIFDNLQQEAKGGNARTLAIFPNALILERLEKFTKPVIRRAIGEIMTEKLYTFELAKKLRGDKNTRAFTRAFCKHFEYEDVRTTSTGVLVVFILENAWILQVNKKNKIKGVYCYGPKSEALKNMFNKF